MSPDGRLLDLSRGGCCALDKRTKGVGDLWTAEWNSRCASADSRSWKAGTGEPKAQGSQLQDGRQIPRSKEGSPHRIWPQVVSSTSVEAEQVSARMHTRLGACQEGRRNLHTYLEEAGKGHIPDWPTNGRQAWLVACFWMLREIELSITYACAT